MLSDLGIEDAESQEEFSEYVHDLKRRTGRGGSDNFSWDDLRKMGEDFLGLEKIIQNE